MNGELQLIGSRINRKRQQSGLSQAALAELLDVSPVHMSDIERGQTNCSITIFRNLSCVLNVSADWLLMLDTDAAYVESANELKGILDGCSQKEIEVILTTIRQLKETLILLRQDESN